MRIGSLIEAFGIRCGTPLEMLPAGTLALSFHGCATINLEHDAQEDMLHVYSTVGQDPVDDVVRVAVYRMLLEANLFGHETLGGTLSLDTTTGELLLTRRVAVDHLDADALYGVVRDMVHAAEQIANHAKLANARNGLCDTLGDRAAIRIRGALA